MWRGGWSSPVNRASPGLRVSSIDQRDINWEGRCEQDGGMIYLDLPSIGDLKPQKADLGIDLLYT